MNGKYEELCQLLGIEKKIDCNHMECPQMGRHGRDKCAVKTRIPNEECIKNKEYTSAFYTYPEFDAYKQLALIKLIGKENGFEYYGYQMQDSECFCTVPVHDFEEALIDLTLSLLGEELLGKKDVKDIILMH